MNHRSKTAAAAALAAAAITAIAGCDSQGAGGKATTARPDNTQSTQSAQGAQADADPTCTIGYPRESGIAARHGRVTGTATLTCSSRPDIALVSVTLAYVPPGADGEQDQGVGNTAYHHAEDAYTATAVCKPGSYSLHVLYGATVAGSSLSDQQWGATADISATDCDQ